MGRRHDRKIGVEHRERSLPRPSISINWRLRIFRRTCARLCHASGGKLEQIQFLLGHSVQTTKRYLGCKQQLQSAVNDRTDIELQL
jgi:integrase